MTPEELEELRALVGRLNGTAYNENLAVILGAALEHIDQQAASLDEAEALTKKNAERMNGYLTRIAELEALRSDVLKAIRRQVTTSDKGLIMYLWELDEYAARMTKRANELETTIREKDDEIALLRNGYSTKIAQVAALQEIAIEQKAMRICTIPANWWNEGEQVKEYFRASARRQLAKEHPEAFR